MRPVISATFLLLTLLTTATTADDWTRFRGPDGQGQCDEGRLPTKWTADDYVWRVKLPGVGHSSPVVAGERVFVTCGISADGSRIIQSRKTADGSLVWQKSFPSKVHDMNKFNSYCASTPALDAKNVYMTWTTPEEYIVAALTQDKGTELWRRDLGPFVAEHGFGASPMLAEGTLILTNDQLGPSSIVALDPATGRTLWKVGRKSVKTAYSTPCLFRPKDGPAQLIVTSTAHGMTSLAPKTGNRNWELEVFKMRVVGSPAIAAGLIYSSAGSGGGGKTMVAVRPGSGGQKAEVVYKVKGSLPYVPTPVAYGDLLFLWSDQGVVTCLDAPTGKTHWKKRVGGQYFGSPIRVGDRICCVSREGEVRVIAAARKHELLSEVSLGEPSNATPIVVDKVVYFRSISHLMALQCN